MPGGCGRGGRAWALNGPDLRRRVSARATNGFPPPVPEARLASFRGRVSHTVQPGCCVRTGAGARLGITTAVREAASNSGGELVRLLAGGDVPAIIRRTNTSRRTAGRTFVSFFVVFRLAGCGRIILWTLMCPASHSRGRMQIINEFPLRVQELHRYAGCGIWGFRWSGGRRHGKGGGG